MIGLDTNTVKSLFNAGFINSKNSNTTTIMDCILGIQVLRNDEPVMQASSTRGKSFALCNSLLLRQEKFEAADVNWQYVPFATAKSFASNAHTVTTSTESFNERIYFLHEQAVRDQEVNLGRTLAMHYLDRVTNGVLQMVCLCPSFSSPSILPQFSASW